MPSSLFYLFPPPHALIKGAPIIKERVWYESLVIPIHIHKVSFSFYLLGTALAVASVANTTHSRPLYLYSNLYSLKPYFNFYYLFKALFFPLFIQP